MFALDPSSRSWRRVAAGGRPPPRGFGSAAAAGRGVLFVFGGHRGCEDDSDYVEGDSNDLYQ